MAAPMMLMTIVLTVILILCSGVVASILAETWNIDPEGTGDFPDLHTACIAAAHGDTILLSSGYYDESESRIHIETKGIAIIGIGPVPDSNVLCAKFYYGDSQGSLLENLTIEDSNFPLNIWESNVAMHLCIFRRNMNTQGSEAPISCYLSDVLIEDCVFLDNFCQNGVGGAIRGATVTVRRSVFVDNRAALWGGAIFTFGDSMIEDCVFFRNVAPTGAAVAMSGNVILRGCTFLANEVTGPNGGTIALTSDHSEVISHCTIAGTVDGYGIDCNGTVGIFECCDIWANEMGPCFGWCGNAEEHGNFSLDPLFCDSETGDVGLLEGSPCLPGNHGGYECGLIGAKGLGCGEVPVLRVTWGEVKATYK